MRGADVSQSEDYGKPNGTHLGPIRFEERLLEFYPCLRRTEDPGEDIWRWYSFEGRLPQYNTMRKISGARDLRRRHIVDKRQKECWCTQIVYNCRRLYCELDSKEGCLESRRWMLMLYGVKLNHTTDFPHENEIDPLRWTSLLRPIIQVYECGKSRYSASHPSRPHSLDQLPCYGNRPWGKWQ